MGTFKDKAEIIRHCALAVLVASLLVIPSGALAQEADSRRVTLDGIGNHTEVFDRFKILEISSVAGELGFQVSLVAAADGAPFFVLADENQAQMVLRPLMCSGDGLEAQCNALLMSIVLGGFPNANLARANAFNDAQFFARTHMTGEGQAVVSRFLIGEYGVVKGNLATEIYSFRSAGYNFARYLSALQVSAKPGAPALGGGSLGAMGSHGVLSGQTGEMVSVVPGLAAQSEQTAGIDRLIRELETTGMLGIVTNDVSEMIAPQ